MGNYFIEKLLLFFYVERFFKNCFIDKLNFKCYNKTKKEKKMNNTKWVSQTIKIDKDFFPKKMDLTVKNILYSRGIDTPEKVEKFLKPELSGIGNPYGFADMEKSVKKIEEAIKEQKSIWIYGDYDVDGITSTVVLYNALKELGVKNVNYYIPLREEGYGLNLKALQKIKEEGGDLVITVDCGITAFEEVEFANSIELPIIITDHHNLFEEKIPNAFSTVEPKRKENVFPFTMLAGVGTIFMVVLCLYERAGIKEKAFELIDLVGIGTIADVVPLVEENRIFAKFGLEQLKKTENLGLKMLLGKLFPESSSYESDDIGFKIAPLFNAAGRLEDAKVVVELLLSNDKSKIEKIIEKLLLLNEERKDLQNSIVDEIDKELETVDMNKTFVIVNASEKFHHGVLGIVASKIVDKHYRPTIVMEIKKEEGIATGSCRSIDGFNILEALQSMPELFTKFGGHSGAAGLTIPIKNIPEFKRKINEYAKNIMTSEILLRTIKYDEIIPLYKVSYGFFQTLNALKPFGEGNKAPIFRLNNVCLEGIRLIGKNKDHIMYNVLQEDFYCKNSVWFGAGNFFEELGKAEMVDIIFEIKNEIFRGEMNTKIFTIDIKPSTAKEIEKIDYLNSIKETVFPLKSICYILNLLNNDKSRLKLSKKTEYKINIGENYCELLNEGKSIGTLNTNDSKLLFLLKKYFNYNFKAKICSFIKTDTGDIAEILIEKDYSFENKKTGSELFKEIKEFVVGNKPYSLFSKKILSSFFKQNENLIIEEEINEKELIDCLLTIAIYYKTVTGEKSQIISEEKWLQKDYIKEYFDINTVLKDNYPFTFFTGKEKMKLKSRYINLKTK